MATGKDLIKIAKTRLGSKYILGIIAPKDDKNYRGPFDCAEFASWVVYQATGRLYGCYKNDGNPKSADAYSGFWGRDADIMGTKISVERATQTVGSCVLRLAGNGQIGHIVFSQGNGMTVEANSTKYGTIESKLAGRRWDTGILVPWINYVEPPFVIGEQEESVTVYRLTDPITYHPFIKKIQKALGIKQDGKYGVETFSAVKAFQIKKGLVADGEVGAKTIKVLGI